MRPEYFTRDFANGIQVYDKSSFMHIYPLAQRCFGISPENMIPWVILGEIVFLAVCAAYFCRAIAPTAPLAVACMFAVLLISGTVRDMELTNFGGSFFWGLYYNVADGFRLLGIALFLRRRLLWAALLFAASFTVHPVMALMGCAFAFGCLFVERRSAEPGRVVLATILFGIVAGTWWLLKFRTVEMSSGAIDAQTWVTMARAFSFHFFPVDYGTLTLYHDRHLLPLLCLVTLATFYLPRICADDGRCAAILAGMLVLAVLTVVGLLASVYVPLPALIKLGLPRASDMLILVALAVVVAGLVGDVQDSPLWSRALAGAMLLSPLVMKPGIPLLATLLLVVPRLRESLGGNRARVARLAPAVLCLGVLVLGISYWLAGIVKPQHFPAYVGSRMFWMIAAGAGVFVVVAVALDRKWPRIFEARRLSLVVLVLAVGVLSLHWVEHSGPEASDRKRGEDYLEAQLWANANTPGPALFMVDPTIYYGWRDFSSRSSFGNLREWLHTSWLYDSRAAQYAEGKKRFDELGIDIAPYLNDHPSINGFYKLSDEVRRRFYGMEPSRLLDLAKRYGVDYLVLSKSAVQRSYPFRKVFENDSFFVYELSLLPASSK
ncbi:MAG: hypothetical protein FIA96_15235 [Betaproteobacteria bacterium]|nr:hypothetical protein [Betaproteobacteria bacterium]